MTIVMFKAPPKTAHECFLNHNLQNTTNVIIRTRYIILDQCLSGPKEMTLNH